MKKRIVIQFCVTAKEKRALQKAAKRHGGNLSAWIRWALECWVVQGEAK